MKSTSDIIDFRDPMKFRRDSFWRMAERAPKGCNTVVYIFQQKVKCVDVGYDASRHLHVNFWGFESKLLYNFGSVWLGLMSPYFPSSSFSAFLFHFRQTYSTPCVKSFRRHRNPVTHWRHTLVDDQTNGVCHRALFYSIVYHNQPDSRDDCK